MNVSNRSAAMPNINGSGNMSTPVSYFDYFNPGTPFDIAMDILLILALVVSSYIFVSLLLYEWHTRRNEKSDGSGKKSRKVNFGPWLRALCILSALFCVLRCVNDILYYKAQTMSDIPCTMLKNLGVSWLVEVDTTVYLFLWLRHRVLYRNRNLKLRSNVFIKIGSVLALSLIIGLFITMNAIILGWRRYVYIPTKAKCSSVNRMANAVHSHVFLAGSTTLHIVLVALYVYPIVRHAMKTTLPKTSLKKLNDAQDIADAQKKLNVAATKHGKGLMGVVVKSMILSLICVVTDGLTIITARFWITADDHTKLRHFIYNLNIIVNTIAIVANFKDWKSMLFPCFIVSKRPSYLKKTSITSVTTT